MDTLEYIEFKRKYKGKWIAKDIKTGMVLSSDSNLKKLASKMGKSKRKYVIEKVLPLNSAFIP